MKAFVIMPYGGSDPDKVKEYSRIFRFLIKESILQVDPNAEVLVQNHTMEGGQIVRNVIRNIAECDIAIADISDRNWNVAYELGLRHVMNKYGTILICNNRTELPYDIQHLNVITYPADSWLDQIEEITAQIAETVRKALRRERTDSPVFDIYSALPPSLVEMLSSNNDAEQQRLMQLNEQLTELRAENDRLRQRIERAGLDSASTNAQRDVRSLFREAMKNRIYNSDEAVAKLRELADARDYEGFSDFLAKVLQNGYLDEVDCRIIYSICKRIGVPDVTRIYLETVVEFYPDNEELKVFLANAYSQDYHKRDKALSIINESLGIRRKDGKFELAPKTRSRQMLGALFDVYLHLKNYNDLITIGELLLKTDTREIPLIYRNLCMASIRLNAFTRAKTYLDSLLEEAPDDDMTYYIVYKYYDAIHNYVEAYKAVEKCIHLDREDVDYYFIMAGHICDERIARTPMAMAVERIEPNERERYAAPFVLQGFAANPKENFSRAINFLKRNKFADSEKLLTALAQGKLDWESLIQNYDFRMVEYCYTSIE